MKVTWTIDRPEKATTGALAVPFRPKGENRAFAALDKAASGNLSKIAASEKFEGGNGSILSWQGAFKGTAKRIIVFGLGAKDIRASVWRTAVARAVNIASRHQLGSIAVFLDSDIAERQVLEARWTVEAMHLSAYKFDRYKTKKKSVTVIRQGKIGVYPQALDDAACRKACREANAVAEGVILARDLVNEPANILSPEMLARTADDLAAKTGLECTVFDEDALRREKMNLILSVAAGSSRKPSLIHLVYKPEQASNKRVVLIGKGVTFDSGGLCIKPAKSMEDMKTDMAGAAVVLGVMSALQVLKPKVEIHGIIPATDNAVNGNATRPGDVFRSFSNVSVEVVNTDAEGRLILADAIAYAKRLKPTVIIDHATLTGACVVALGQHRAGLFSNQDKAADAYLAAADRTDEFFWRLPLTDELEPEIRSDVADIKNSGGRWGGAITAALFLKRFVGRNSWIHVDIAGPARAEKNTPLCPRGGSGFGVLTACSYVAGLEP